MSGLLVARPLGIRDKPVTRVENFCASGSEAFRQAAYAVSSGAYDVAMAIGVEKLKDSGYQGANAAPVPSDGTNRTVTAAAMYSMIVPAYAKRYGVDIGEVKQALARIASKNHANGARNPRAQFRKEMSVEQLLAMPRIAGELSVFDCAGVADGAAAAVVVRAEDAHKLLAGSTLRESAVLHRRRRERRQRSGLRLHDLSRGGRSPHRRPTARPG